MFDGNQQRISSMHAYLPEEGGGRSIAVHSAAIWTAIERVYDARELLEELKSAQPGKGRIKLSRRTFT